MAAYGALVSLMHIIDQLQRHRRPPITLDKTQAQSLTENIASLQEYLEKYSSGDWEGVDVLESRVRDAAYTAEDVIESHVVDQILAQSTAHDGEIRAVDLYEELQNVIREMDSIRKVAMEINQCKLSIKDQDCVAFPMLPSSHSPIRDTMVGFDEELKEMLDKVFNREPTLGIIPIVGMVGTGKTTLARNVYCNRLIEQHFEIRAWVTISLEYDIRQILSQILDNHMRWENYGQMGEKELGIELHKSLCHRRYLIVMDDVWGTEPWEKMKRYLPDNKNGSRIIITTRSSKVARDLSGTSGVEMKFLDEEKSWDLLSRCVFGKDDCPLQLKQIGRKIVQMCKGLPLAIIVTGGLLAKSDQTQQYWEYVVENQIPTLNLEINEAASELICASYNLLPIHLKPCFLHLSIFPQDSEIHVPELLKVWVAEGFLKPINTRSLEEVAEEYLDDLIQRNLILVGKRGISGEIKSCSIPKVLRDMCIREADREKFVSITSQQHRLDDPHGEGIKDQRSIAIEGTSTKVENFSKVAPQFTSRRSLICVSDGMLPSHHFRLLRLLKEDHTRYQLGESDSLDDIFQFVNSRYLDITTGWNNPAVITGWGDGTKRSFPPSLCRLWNIQTLTVKGWYGHAVVAPPEFWNMYSLRHVNSEELYLPDPPCNHTDEQDGLVLENLQTLMKVMNFKCSEEAVKRIPNVKTLKLSYMDIDDEPEPEVASQYCLNYLGRLDKLESLGCVFPFKRPSRNDFVQNINFPNSLKKLTLYGTGLHWEDMSKMIGSLPKLEVLKLKYKSFIGAEWQPIEGDFISLKYLLISFCNDLEYWNAQECHFPRLERLVLENLLKLREIPPGIGDIPTLQSIQLKSCSVSAILSAKQILEEQSDCGNEDLHARVLSVKKDHLPKNLESENFEVITSSEVKHEPVEYKSEDALQA